jgi:endogenous inhibitor of DNA gyrase (YacG/DUF329 family)
MCPPPDPASKPVPGKPVQCPICRKPAADAYRPFCSKRCADIDLAKWFGGAYAVPGREEDEGDGGGFRGEDDGSGTGEK